MFASNLRPKLRFASKGSQSDMTGARSQVLREGSRRQSAEALRPFGFRQRDHHASQSPGITYAD